MLFMINSLRIIHFQKKPYTKAFVLFIFALLILKTDAYAQDTKCNQELSTTLSIKTFEKPRHFLRWLENVYDGVYVFGVKDFLVSSLYSMGVRPRYVFRGLGSIFVINYGDHNFNRTDLRVKANQLIYKINEINQDIISEEERSLLLFFIHQIKYMAHGNFFNVSARIAKSWQKVDGLKYVDSNTSHKHWASSVLHELKSLEFILRVRLPKNKNIHPDDDGPSPESEGIMTTFRGDELSEQKLEDLVFRVRYKGRNYWPNGPIKNIWLPLLLLNQRSVDFLVHSGPSLSGEELLKEIRKIYSETDAMVTGARNQSGRKNSP